jgi:hypothetical protein
MRLAVSLFSLSLCLGLTPVASAQDVLYVTDTGNDQVLTCIDANNDGDVDDAGEIVVLYSAALGPYALTIAPGICPGPGNSVFLCDTTFDVVLSLTDTNNDGDALDAGEPVIFFDGRVGGNAENVLLNSANSMIFEAATSTLWITTQNTGVAGSLDEVLAVRDNNNDGDANDLGEVVHFWTGPAGAVNLYAPQAIVVESATRVVYADSGVASNKGAYSLTDLNNDGDANDAGERNPYFLLPVVSPVQQLFCLERDAQGWYYMADFQYDAIYRFKDLDSDGDAMDAGESTTWFVSPAATTFYDLAAAPDGTLYVTDGTPALTHVYALKDLNNDGDAQDAGESREVYSETGGNPVVIDLARGLAMRSLDTPTTSFCLGDGTAAACPCGNTGAAGHGCAGSSFATGAILTASGIAGASASTDTLVLTATGIPGPGLFFQASGLAPTPFNFGDGHLCAAVSIIRMGVVFSTGGVASYPGGTTPNPIHVAGLTSNGDVRHYQCWYRSVPSLCTAIDNFNTTQGLTLTWGP